MVAGIVFCEMCWLLGGRKSNWRGGECGAFEFACVKKN